MNFSSQDKISEVSHYFSLLFIFMFYIIHCWKFLLKQPLNLENMILHIEFCNPLLCGIAENTQGEIPWCGISGYDKFDKMSLNDLTSCGHTAKSTIKVLKNR